MRRIESPMVLRMEGRTLVYPCLIWFCSFGFVDDDNFDGSPPWLKLQPKILEGSEDGRIVGGIVGSGLAIESLLKRRIELQAEVIASRPVRFITGRSTMLLKVSAIELMLTFLAIKMPGATFMHPSSPQGPVEAVNLVGEFPTVMAYIGISFD